MNPKYQVTDVIAKLKEFNLTVNGKMGVTCVRAIITWLERGDIDSARNVARNDFFGKLWQYKSFGLPQYVNEVFDLDVGYCTKLG